MLERKDPHDVLSQLGMTLEDFASSVFLTGTTGSGKTSVMKILAYAVLNLGSGCLWACTKANEAANAEAVIQATVMRDRLLRLVPGRFTFNFRILSFRDQAAHLRALLVCFNGSMKC